MTKVSHPTVLREFTFENSYLLFLLDPLQVKFDLPFEICPGIIFDQANEEEKEKIKYFLSKKNQFHGPYTRLDLIPDNNCYVFGQMDKSYKENEEVDFPSVGLVVEFLSEDAKKFVVPVLDCEWDYWVVRIAENVITKREFFLFFEALLYSLANVSVGLWFEENGTYGYYVDIQRFYQRYPVKLVFKSGRLQVKDYQRNLALEQLKDITNVFNLLKKFDFGKYPFIRQAVSEYVNLLALPIDSSLNIVGLFSILELLLTNDSRSNGSPSITWQLKKKIPLLNRRFDEPLDFPALFHAPDDTKEETFIERLYLKRSLVAHGNKDAENFDSKLQVISQGDAVEFLRLIIRKIIIYSLKDPQLLQYLREC